MTEMSPAHSDDEGRSLLLTPIHTGYYTPRGMDYRRNIQTGLSIEGEQHRRVLSIVVLNST